MTPAQKQAKLAAIIKMAASYIGTKEIGTTNKGTLVDKFLAAANCPPGNSWCMGFVVAMFLWNRYLLVNGVSVLIATASCQAQAEHARKIGTLVSADDARKRLIPGYVMLQWHPELNRYAHTGIVDSYDAASGTFTSIEGNTNANGARQGTEVRRQTRHIAEMASDGHARYAFIQTA